MSLIEQLFNPHQPAKGAWDMSNMRPATDTVMINYPLLGEVYIERSKYNAEQLKEMRKKQLRRQKISEKILVTPNRIIES